MNADFRNYAVKHLGMNGLALDQYIGKTSPITSSYISPTIIEERQLNVAQMDVFSRLMMDRIIFLGTTVDDYSANVIQAQLLYLDSCDPGKDVSIYINSPGGSVYAGLGIYDTMQYISSNVSTICTGMAASMAAVLLVAGAKGKRFALKHSRIMIHQPMGGVQGQASDIEITAREILKLKDELYSIISQHSGQSFEKIVKDSDRDYWMTSQEAAEYGMIDKVLERQPQESADNNNKVEENKYDLQAIIKQAKNKILDLAIHGKLVQQDLNEEPASELLNRINPKAEITCDNGHYTQLPFEVPQNWSWTTLGKIGKWQSGSTPNRLNKDYYNGNIPWLKTGDLNDGYITHIPEYITEKALNETSVKLNPTGSVLIAMYGACRAWL